VSRSRSEILRAAKTKLSSGECCRSFMRRVELGNVPGAVVMGPVFSEILTQKKKKTGRWREITMEKVT